MEEDTLRAEVTCYIAATILFILTIWIRVQDLGLEVIDALMLVWEEALLQCVTIVVTAGSEGRVEAKQEGVDVLDTGAMVRQPHLPCDGSSRTRWGHWMY